MISGANLQYYSRQVQNGKNAMPAWEGVLDEDEIAAVASYVFDQAKNDKR